jgi:5-methylcytosine-specific restriction endonuclease McrA
MSLSRCGRRYPTEQDARCSKRGQVDDAVVFACPRAECGGWHVRVPMAPEHRRKITEERRARVYDAEWYARSAEKRFAKSVADGPVPSFRPELGPCLLFTGAPSDNGYGQFRYNQRNGYAHRYAWERVNGPIPAGLTIDHLCRVRKCVRLTHLEVVPGVVNFLRAAEAWEKCPKGHPYGNDNRAKGKNRRCGKCEAAARKRSGLKRSRKANGLPDRKIKYDQEQVRVAIEQIRAGSVSIAQAAREIGCNCNYLGRRTWNAVKRDVSQRDGGLCVSCGLAAVDAQHRIARRSGGTRNPLIAYGMANVISLCRSCHHRCEDRDREMRARGCWLESWQNPRLEGVMYFSPEGSGFTAWLDDDGGLSFEPPAEAGAA